MAQQESARDRATTTALALLVWGLAGAVFGAIFVAVQQVLIAFHFTGWQPLIIGTCIAAMTTSALYSAMTVALVGAGAGVLASIGYLVGAGQQVELPMLAGLTIGMGVISGALFKLGPHHNARALGVTLTGLLAGTSAGLAMAILLALSPQPIAPAVVAAGIVALVGTLFEFNQNWLIEMSRGRLATLFGAPLVAGLTAAVVGISVWIMVGSGANLDLPTKERILSFVNDVPAGLTGGLIGGLVSALLLKALGCRIEDYTDI